MMQESKKGAMVVVLGSKAYRYHGRRENAERKTSRFPCRSLSKRQDKYLLCSRIVYLPSLFRRKFSLSYKTTNK